MSILLNQNSAGLLTIPAFFSSAAGVPLTVAFAIKVNTLPASGFNQFDVMKLDGGTGFSLAAIAQNSSASHTIRAQTNDGSVSSTASLEKFGSMAGQWVKCVCVFNSNTNKIVYSLDGSGNLMTSATGTSSRPASGEVNLRLLSTWASGAVRVNNLTIYRGVGLTSSQAKELMDTDSVSGLTPYAKWDTTTAWGATVNDVSGNNRHITPPVAWAYDADNPVFEDFENAPPVVSGSKLNALEYQISVSGAGGSLTYSVIMPPSNGTATVNSSGLVTYTPGVSFTGSDSFVVSVSDEIETTYNTITISDSAGLEISERALTASGLTAVGLTASSFTARGL